MAIYHFSVKIIGRSKGSSSVASAAYRSGQKLEDERTGLVHDYTRKTGVEYNDILAPESAAEFGTNRKDLWNTVEAAEKRKDAQLAREINAALPIELNRDQQIEIVKGYVKNNFVDNGMIADISIHDNSKGNPHVHIMLTTREITKDGFGKKNREWNKKENIDQWREQWAVYTNRSLEKYGFKERVDHRTLKEQGIDRIPEIHVGVHANAMEKKKGMETERGNLNREIKELNNQRVIAIDEYRELNKEKIQKQKAELQRYSNLTEEEKANVLKAEKIIGRPQDYKNSNEILSYFNEVKTEKFQEIKYLEDEVRSTEDRIKDIENNLSWIKNSENEINNIPKILGIYRDRRRVKDLRNDIEIYNKNLVKLDYKDSNNLISMKNKVNNLSKNIKDLKNEIEKINEDSWTVQKGVRALRNKELREFCSEYKEEFINPRIISYKEMMSIKAANKLWGGKMPVKSMHINQEIIEKKIDKIDKILRNIEDGRNNLSRADAALNTVEKLKSIAEKYDKKILGKKKYRSDHQYEKDKYDRSLNELKDLNISSRYQFMRKESRQNSREIDIRPRLENEREGIKPILNILREASAIFRVKEYEYSRQEKEREIRRLHHRKKIDRGFEMEL
ncbi:MobQ family relaxase [Clostridium sp.]|uniref:MobQ family relaxase n=1 Tax=Clostridium sp. TaxID=1506 RepID=UPI00258C947A|nr:MobQ family relaxase [Clostridium sp.]MDF2505178.1 MobA/MobL family protein [Clostridium sp.]